LRMEGVPRPNTLADLARRFQRRDIHRLADDERQALFPSNDNYLSRFRERAFLWFSKPFYESPAKKYLHHLT